MPEVEKYDVLVVGAGPAGLSAAFNAFTGSNRVGLIDDNPAAGGQIYRPSQGKTHPWVGMSVALLDKVGITVQCGLSAVDAPDPGILAVQSFNGKRLLRYEKLILCTGARELFLPFPGWTLPNAMGVGGLQALVKSGLDVAGRRIVVAGSGPLLLAVADYLKKHDGLVVGLFEQAPMASLKQFGLSMLGYPSKWMQGLALGASVGRMLRADSWVVEAGGRSRVEWVKARTPKGEEQIECEYLACAYGFVPSNELAVLLGCATRNGFVTVDDLQQTSIANVYCAGEPTGIGGVDLSTTEGRIAGLAASGREDQARSVLGRRERWRQFAANLDTTFAPRPELKDLVTPETIVCRCEDVTAARLSSPDCGRAAKLHTRCGMGPCQGRICGPATKFLYGWDQGSVRPPLYPVPIAALADSEPTNG